MNTDELNKIEARWRSKPWFKDQASAVTTLRNIAFSSSPNYTAEMKFVAKTLLEKEFSMKLTATPSGAAATAFTEQNNTKSVKEPEKAPESDPKPVTQVQVAGEVGTSQEGSNEPREAPADAVPSASGDAPTA